MTLTGSISTAIAGPEGVRRLFAARDASLASHLALFGSLPGGFDEGHLLAEVEASGLVGRGGASFPLWRKLVAARSAVASGRPRSASAVVVANGAEGEPLSRKDAALLYHAPHLVLDGLLVTAASTRAGDLVVYAPPGPLEAVARAVSERRDGQRIRLVPAADTFLSGEASAVVNAVAGRPALPSDHVARLTDSGLDGRPTLVQNVETLAHLALIARFGASWFRSVGTPDEPGTRLVSLGGDLPSSPVLETAGGAPIRDSLTVVGTDPARLRAVLVGGYHGAWVPADSLVVGLSRAELAVFGAAPGAGILHAIGRDRCGLEATADIVTYLAGQSAKQCGPCANGLPRMADVLARLARGERATWLPAEVARLAALVSGRGSCHHPDGTARLVLSALSVFADDVQEHLEGRCEARR